MDSVTPGKVLVIDDDVDIRTSVVNLFMVMGWETIEGEDGNDALVLAQREMPDLIVMDLMMPEKDGLVALKELRENSAAATIPVIMLTAANDFQLGAPLDKERIAVQLGVAPPEAFLEKPFEAKRLTRTVEQVMASYS